MTPKNQLTSVNGITFTSKTESPDVDLARESINGMALTQRQALPMAWQVGYSGAGAGPIPHNPKVSRESLFLLARAQVLGVPLTGLFWVTCSSKNNDNCWENFKL